MKPATCDVCRRPVLLIIAGYRKRHRTCARELEKLRLRHMRATKPEMREREREAANERNRRRILAESAEGTL